MTNANVTNVTIRPEEEAHFSSLAREWWNAKGPMASLHEVNPVRLAFLREAIDMYWGDDVQARRPLSGRSALDVGCGAGLVCEPMARLGADVTGVDASAENIGVASAHAESSALDIRYMAGELASLTLGTFHLVTSFEVIEHVADKLVFLKQLATSLKPDGMLVKAKRTPPPVSFRFMIFVWAAPPTRDTDTPALIAGLTPALNRSVSKKI